MIIKTLKNLKAKNVLDVGCASGQHTKDVSSYCDELVAVDPNQKWINRAKQENNPANVNYSVMDGRALDFKDNRFDVVYARGILHHMEGYKRCISEMIRVSSSLVLIEEPIDEMRSQEKINSYEARQLYLSIQKEVDYSHFNHIPIHELLDYLKEEGCRFSYDVIKNDEMISFDEFFEYFPAFCNYSDHPEYWNTKLEKLRETMGNLQFADDDTVFIVLLNPVQ